MIMLINRITLQQLVVALEAVCSTIYRVQMDTGIRFTSQLQIGYINQHKYTHNPTDHDHR